MDWRRCFSAASLSPNILAASSGENDRCLTIRTRLTLVVVLATVAGAIVGWLLRSHPILSGAFVGGVAAAAIAVFVVSRLLVTDPANSILQAVSDGLLSFSEREYGMRLAAPNADEVLGDLVRRFNKLGEALRTEHNDRYQREILLETVLETTSMAIVDIIAPYCAYIGIGL